MMAKLRDRFGALRWDGELICAIVRCAAGMVHLRDIQCPPEPLLSPRKGTREYVSYPQNGARDVGDLPSLASIGADIDAGAVGRGCYVYRIRGAMYRRFGPIEPEEGAAPKYAQIHLFDAAEAAEFRGAYAMGKCGARPSPIST